ncbi:hypothetical protein [Photobacterium aphoticum]
MACHISELLDAHHDKPAVPDKHFNGCHYDANIGGWVSNLWDPKK